MTYEDTHCKHGHEWTEANTYHYLDKHGRHRRKCRACTLRRLGEKRLNLGKLRKVMKVNEGGDNRENDVTECMRVNKLIHLQEELDRETRTWLRPEIQAEIDKLKCD
jgi:hypothetical protein